LDNDETRATYALREMQKLYAIEHSCREQRLNCEEIKAARMQQAVPIPKDLGVWLQQQYVQVLPKSTIGKAIAYSLERWERLRPT
jgi:transposase